MPKGTNAARKTSADPKILIKISSDYGKSLDTILGDLYQRERFVINDENLQLSSSDLQNAQITSRKYQK